MTIYVGEDDPNHGQSLYSMILDCLFYNQVSGVTFYLGSEGDGASTLISRSGSLSIARDAPVIVMIVDSEENNRKVTPVREYMLIEGLIAMSDVEAIKYVDEDGARS